MNLTHKQMTFAFIFLSLCNIFHLTDAKKTCGKGALSKTADIALYSGYVYFFFKFLANTNANLYANHTSDTINLLKTNNVQVLGFEESTPRNTFSPFFLASCCAGALFVKNRHESMQACKQQKNNDQDNRSLYIDSTLGALFLASLYKAIQNHSRANDNFVKINCFLLNNPKQKFSLEAGRLESFGYFAIAAAMLGTLYLKNCWETQHYEIEDADKDSERNAFITI